MRIFFLPKGQTLVELLIAIGFAGILLPALLTGFVTSRSGKAQQIQKASAVELAQEAGEAIRSVRENSWNTFAVNGTYYPQQIAGVWSLASGTQTIQGFTRKITISDAMRDTNGALVSTGGTIDPSTKKIVASVSWTTPFTSAVSNTTYVTRYLGNTTYSQTTEADFNSGTKNNVVVANANGGEVVLGEDDGSVWCAATVSSNTLDLPKNGVANAIAALEGIVAVGAGDTSAGVSYAQAALTNTHPPIPSLSGTFNGYKTNDVFVEPNYVYVATNNTAKEIVILDISQTPYTEIGYFDIPGTTQAASVSVSGNTGYAIAGASLYLFDVSSKIGPRGQTGATYSLLGTGTNLVIKGNYAYVTALGSSTQLQIFNVTNPGFVFPVAWANLNGQDGRRVIINSDATRAYIVTSASTTKQEFFIVNITSKSGSRPTIGSYEANDMNPKSLAIVPGNKAILVGNSGEEYQVVDITTESNPARCGGLEVNSGINGISFILEADGDVYSYIITGDPTAELKIILGGFTGQLAATGIFESSTFDALSSVAFNRFVAKADKPNQTNVTFQVAGADVNPATGNCTGASFTFVGSDGTSNTYFATGSAIPTQIAGSMTYKNPARCFRYKAFFSTSDGTKTPTLHDITVNYSP